MQWCAVCAADADADAGATGATGAACFNITGSSKSGVAQLQLCSQEGHSLTLVAATAKARGSHATAVVSRQDQGQQGAAAWRFLGHKLLMWPCEPYLRQSSSRDSCHGSAAHRHSWVIGAAGELRVSVCTADVEDVHGSN